MNTSTFFCENTENTCLINIFVDFLNIYLKQCECVIVKKKKRNEKTMVNIWGQTSVVYT